MTLTAGHLCFLLLEARFHSSYAMRNPSHVEKPWEDSPCGETGRLRGHQSRTWESRSHLGQSAWSGFEVTIWTPWHDNLRRTHPVRTRIQINGCLRATAPEWCGTEQQATRTHVVCYFYHPYKYYFMQGPLLLDIPDTIERFTWLDIPPWRTSIPDEKGSKGTIVGKWYLCTKCVQNAQGHTRVSGHSMWKQSLAKSGVALEETSSQRWYLSWAWGIRGCYRAENGRERDRLSQVITSAGKTLAGFNVKS